MLNILILINALTIAIDLLTLTILVLINIGELREIKNYIKKR